MYEFKIKARAIIADLESHKYWLESSRKPSWENFENLEGKLSNFINCIRQELGIHWCGSYSKWKKLSKIYAEKFREHDIIYYLNTIYYISFLPGSTNRVIFILLSFIYIILKYEFG